MNSPVVLVLDDVPEADAASALAEGALDARLAACVTELGAVKSRYRWKGKIEAAEEFNSCSRRAWLAQTNSRGLSSRIILTKHLKLSRGRRMRRLAYGQWITAETQRPLNV